MEKSAPRFNNSGFTLIELLVVIAIITILSLISVLTYRGFTDRAKDTKRKAELSAIAKVYLAKAVDNNKFVPLQNGDFGGAPIPKTPEGNLYPCLIGPDSNCSSYAEDRFAYCVSLGNNQSAPCLSDSPACFCQSGGAINTSSSGGGGSGGGGNPSCDPYGMLSGPFSGLVGYWKMDGNTNDSSGINNGIAPNGLAFSADVPNAQFSQSGSFDGTNDYISVPDNDNLDASGDFTISAWVKLDSLNHNSHFVSKNLYGTSSYTLFIGWEGSSTGKLYFLTKNQNLPTPTIIRAYATSGTITIGRWYHFVAVIKRGSGDNIYLYQDGNEVTYAPDARDNYSVSDILVNNQPLMISDSYINQTIDGLIDDVRIYNKALSVLEVRSLYNNGSGCIP